MNMKLALILSVSALSMSIMDARSRHPIKKSFSSMLKTHISFPEEAPQLPPAQPMAGPEAAVATSSQPIAGASDWGSLTVPVEAGPLETPVDGQMQPMTPAQAQQASMPPMVQTEQTNQNMQMIAQQPALQAGDAMQTLPQQETPIEEVPAPTESPYQDIKAPETAETGVPEIPGQQAERINVPVQDDQEKSREAPRDEGFVSEPISQLLQEGNAGFDEETRKKAVIDLVNKGISYLQSTTTDQAFDAFTHSPDFRKGELYLFVYDTKGNVYAHGGDSDLVWQNVWNLRDKYNTLFVQEIIKKAVAGGGWILYFWENSTKVSYVKSVIKDGVTYVLGCGYFPHSKSDQVVGLVKGAVGLFDQLITKEKYPPEEAFSSYNYPIGRFALGDLYIYVLDFQGTIYAQADRPGLVGTNSWYYQDAQGKYLNQEIIKKLQNVPLGTGIWIKYISKNAPKLSYAQAIRDNAGKYYFVACGYYPLTTREKAINLVKQGYDYMKRNGKTKAVEAINTRQKNTFRFGDLSLAIMDFRGEVIANGDNPDALGNYYNAQDEDGVFFVRDMIRKAQEGGGWINFRSRNSLESVYIEPIDIGLEKYIISCGLFPISKKETALLMVRTAASYLRTNAEVDALRAFSDKNGSFIRGDLAVTVYDSRGIVLVSGAGHSVVLRNMLDAKDDSGKPFVRLLINAVKRGSAQISYTLNGAQRLDFAEQVEKDGKTYIVTVGYYI